MTAAETELGQPGSTLAGQGYEPRIDDERMLLANCPFDRLAQDHTDLICGMNHAYVSGIAEGLGCAHLRADLDPAEGRCCVVVRQEGAGR